MPLHLMAFTDSPNDPTLDDMYAYYDRFEDIRGKELSGYARSWSVGLNGPKLTRKGQIQGYYWCGNFRQLVSRDLLIVFDGSVTLSETKRILNRLQQFLGGTIQNAVKVKGPLGGRSQKTWLLVEPNLDTLGRMFPGSDQPPPEGSPLLDRI